MFGVDAQKLEKNKVLKKRSTAESTRFDKIVFNFPHVGQFHQQVLNVAYRLLA